MRSITYTETQLLPDTCFILIPSCTIWPKTFVLSYCLLRICPLRIKCSHAAIPCHMHSLYSQCPEYIHDPNHSPQSTHLSSILPRVTLQSLRLKTCSPLLCPRSLSAGCNILPNNHGVHFGLLQLPPDISDPWTQTDANILECCCFFPPSPSLYSRDMCTCIHTCMQVHRHRNRLTVCPGRPACHMTSK